MLQKTTMILALLIGQPTVLWALEKLNFSQALEELSAQQMEPVDGDLYENLWEFYQYPLNLNEATREDLESFGILTEVQIDHFFAHLDQNGPLVSIYELQAIPEFDLKTIYLLLPFVQVSEFYPQHPHELKQLGLKGAAGGYWLGRYERVLEEKEGYKLSPRNNEIPYIGSPNKLITKFQYSYPNKWRFGFSGAKHAGEAFTWDHATTRYAFNTYNAYVLLENKGFFRQILLGDYQVGYGQGLMINAGFSIDKTSDAIPSIRTNNVGIKPYTSTNSDRFRGIAATMHWKQHYIQTIYYAYNLLDARVQTHLKTRQQYVSNIARSSLYRTKTALDKKDQIREQVIGSTWMYQNRKQGIELGINALYHTYNLPIYPVLSKHPYAFRGDCNYNVSLFYRYLWHNFHFFGEAAMCKGNGKAIIVGVIASLPRNMDASLIIRHYSPDFHSPYGKAFRTNSQGNSNEQGIYVGYGLQLTKKLKLATYYNYFKFLTPTWSIPEPSSGYDWLVKIAYQPARPTLWSLQYMRKSKAKKVPQASITKPKDKSSVVATSRKKRVKAQFKHTFNRKLTIATEMQWSHYQFMVKPTWGYGIMQKVTYKLKQWDITGQIAWFDTDNDNKLYFQEKDLLHSRNTPTMYYQQGMKYYLVVAYKLHATWRLEVKYAYTQLIHESTIGSGLEKIQSNTKNEIKLQIIYKF